MKLWCELAWLGGDEPAAGVLLAIDGGVLGAVTRAPDPPPDAERLPGLTLPGLANAHSHAFQLALRGRTHCVTGSFWSWREQMYAVAGRLDPDSYFALARATFAEMALAGVTAVGEFHYLHHPPDGGRYADPNAVGHAVIAAAAEAGIRITLLDTCYLAGGIDRAVGGAQARFSDGSAEAWAGRVDELVAGTRPAGAGSSAGMGAARTGGAGTGGAGTGGAGTGSVGAAPAGVAPAGAAPAGAAPAGAAVRIGAAIHSVRAVPPDAMAVVARWAAEHDAPLHVHLSEQPAENEACLARYGRTPAGLLAKAGALTGRTTAVHGTHLTTSDRATLAAAGSGVCFCPSTERELADGIGPAAALYAAGVPLSLGSDSQAMIDLLAEARALELDQRLATLSRGHLSAADVLGAATEAGARALGWQAGRIAPGYLADLTTVGLGSVRLAGIRPDDALDHVAFAATAADVTQTIVAARPVVTAGRHRIGDVSAALRAALTPLAV